MAYNVAALTAYTDQQKFPLLTISTFEAKSQKVFTPMVDVKSAATVNIIDTDAEFQTGGVCGWSPCGTTAFTQRTLTVGKIMIHEPLCPKTLEAYYMQTQLPRGSKQEEMPFEQQYSELKARKIAQSIEIGIWMGDTTLSGHTNSKYFDGILKAIDNSTGSFQAFPGTNTAAITTTNIISILDHLTDNIPAALMGKDDFVVFCGWDVFKIAITAYKTANLFHFDTGNAWATGEYTIPGTDVKLMAVHGLDLANVPSGSAQSTTVGRIIGTRLRNFFFGCDLMGEENEFEIFWAREAREIRFVTEFKAGTQFAFAPEIIQYGV